MQKPLCPTTDIYVTYIFTIKNKEDIDSLFSNCIKNAIVNVAIILHFVVASDEEGVYWEIQLPLQ